VGIASQGETIEEAMSTTGYAYANLQEATELYLEEFSLAEVPTLKAFMSKT